MINVLSHIVTASGYRNIDRFVDSTFHPKSLMATTITSTALSFIAYYFKFIFGIEAPVGLVIIILFFLEMFTGITASKKNGEGWESEKFGRGWLKLAVYWIMIGCTNILDVYAISPKILGFEFDIYSFVYFAWLNFVILQLLGSNIENFIKLGWDKNSLLIRLLIKIYNIKTTDYDRPNKTYI